MERLFTDEHGKIFKYNPDDPPTDLLMCTLCGATFTYGEAWKMDLDAERCPKCPTETKEKE